MYNRLITLLVDNGRLRLGDSNLALKDSLPTGEVDCFYHYNDAGEQETIKVNLRNTISATGVLSHHPRDYCAHLEHTEESATVLDNPLRVQYLPQEIEKENNPCNIDFDPGKNSVEETRNFNINVLNDLTRRGHTYEALATKTGPERVAMLRPYLLEYEELRRLRDAVDIELIALEKKVADPEDVVTCEVHGEKRRSEKYLHELFIRGAYLPPPGGVAKLVQLVEAEVNDNILGRRTEHSREIGRWKFPLKDGLVSDVKLSNPEARKFIKGLESLVDICLAQHADEYVSTWREMSRKYQSATKLLLSHKEGGWEEACEFQDEADNFMDIYNKVTGRRGMTNYFHYWRDGHLAWMIIERGSVYRFSQQGWEAMNGRLKRTFNHSTQKGGSNSKGKLLSMVLTFVRSSLWAAGYLDEYFDGIQPLPELGRTVKYGEIPKNHYDDKVSDGVVSAFAETILSFGDDTDIHGEFTEEDLNDLLRNGDDDGENIFTYDEVAM